MNITLLQAVLIGLTYYIANTSFLGGQAYFTTWRPLVNGTLVGFILGTEFGISLWKPIAMNLRTECAHWYDVAKKAGLT